MKALLLICGLLKNLLCIIRGCRIGLEGYRILLTLNAAVVAVYKSRL